MYKRLMEKYLVRIAALINVKISQVESVVSLFEQGATVPFISRYRKEHTGNLDEVAVREIELQYKKFTELKKRKVLIIETIKQQGKLSEELHRKIENTFDTVALEDLYLPYKPKKRTKATIAKEKGLEPLANKIIEQRSGYVEELALPYLNASVIEVLDALQGARDIIAERISEDVLVRNRLRFLFKKEAIIISKMVKGKEEVGEKYQDYFDFSEPLNKCPSHRMLAMRRGENEGFLKVNIFPDEDKAHGIIDKLYMKGFSECSLQVQLAGLESYKRLVQPSLGNEFKKIYKEKADQEAIDVFALNLKQLLLTAPLGQKRVLAIDPGFRSGCKVVCLTESGDLVHYETIYPHPPQNENNQSAKIILNLIKSYRIDAIAIGNGTAGRETEQFIRNMRLDVDVQIYMVNESGASIYSASAIAREEFPQHDITVRGSVSIGRRLMDPLAELVKIDAKSIGVGQYQYDVDQSKLKDNLDFVVESCVNAVGVNLNVASKHLLSYVSGLGPKLAENIVEFRRENGAFESRLQLKKVPRMGAKAYEQCVAFLRIPNAKNPLDNSAVHPESYGVVKLMAKDLGCKINDLITIPEVRKGVIIDKYIDGQVGRHTLMDIIKELEKPGRDPRQKIKMFEFDPNVNHMKDLIVGMELPGLISNITNFGAFVDIGVHQDGLVHVSQMADRFISNPAEVVALNQAVRVKVVSVEIERKRIQLSMKGLEQ